MCSFCPVNQASDPRKHIMMKHDLFEKIITELKVLNYSDRIGLFSNNEPFLDKRIIYFVKYAREYLPHAYLYLYTNGSLLTLQKHSEIMQYLDYIVIDNYDDIGELQPEIYNIIKLCEQNEQLNQKQWSVLESKMKCCTLEAAMLLIVSISTRSIWDALFHSNRWLLGQTESLVCVVMMRTESWHWEMFRKTLSWMNGMAPPTNAYGAAYLKEEKIVIYVKSAILYFIQQTIERMFYENFGCFIS